MSNSMCNVCGLLTLGVAYADEKTAQHIPSESLSITEYCAIFTVVIMLLAALRSWHHDRKVYKQKERELALKEKGTQ